ncbi:sialic acid-binding Ig-like lectin 11 [Dromiciops gliroides]|uniref:sialic acid-binding Ig-like lectin 11 n=1 Tax=Dromiciops gliroides TaxID=33562 RepID=UPI001CC72843|nr:sialic acid-binding Ig-like lectin 11 [Dromiciops gliroides]
MEEEISVWRPPKKLPLSPEPDRDDQRDPWCWESDTVAPRTWLSAAPEMLLLLLLLPLLWEGSLSQRLYVQPSVSVQEGLCARVPCTFYYPSPFNSNPVYGYWFSERNNVYHGTPVATNDPFRMVEGTAQGRFHLLGDPRMNNCSLSITDAQFSDRGRYFFRVENGHEKYTWKPLYVTVKGLIQKPDISVPEVLESGKSVTLKCTFPSDCGGNRAFKFSWRGAALSSQPGTSGTSHSSEVSFIPGHQHHGTSLTCQVTLPGGRLSPERTIQLNVSYAVQNVTITISQDNRTTVWVPRESSPLVVQEGGSLHLLCAAHSNPPATLSWMLGDQTLASSQPSHDGILPLDLPHLRPADEGNYTCHAQHPLGSKQVSLRFSVHYPPKMLNLSCSWFKGVLLCTCSVQAEPAPSLHWQVGGKLVEGNSSSNTFQVISSRSGPWANSSLSVKMDRVPNIDISCEGKNLQGTHTLLFQLVPDRSTLSHAFQKGIITGVLCGAGVSSLLALCLLLLLVKMLRKKSLGAEASSRRAEDPKRPAQEGQSLHPISSAADAASTPAAPEDAPDELHYACLSFQGKKAREDHGSTDPLTEYSEIKFH